MSFTVRHPRIEGYEVEVDDLAAAEAAGWVSTAPAPDPEPAPEPVEEVTVTDEPAPEPTPKRARRK